MTKCFDFMECTNIDRCTAAGRCLSHEPAIPPLDIATINAMPEARGWWPCGMNNRVVRLARAAYEKGVQAARAADREARPAPATSVLHYDRSTRDKFELGWNAALDRLAAASTPPAEAGDRLFRGFLAAAERDGVTHLSDPAASEARATGDAAVETLLDEWAEAAGQRWYHAGASRGIETGKCVSREDLRQLVRAALSDRSTGAVPAGPKPCSVGVNGGRKEVILTFHTTADALAWSDAMIDSASAPAAPPVAPAETPAMTSKLEGSTLTLTFNDAAQAAAYEAAILEKFIERAATGAAGEPQPREVNR